MKITENLKTQHAGTLTNVHVIKPGKEELIYSCRGYTNLEELKEAAKKYAQEHGCEEIKIEVL
jgi:fructose-1-phosphate kinase PfkB-like protein